MNEVTTVRIGAGSIHSIRELAAEMATPLLWLVDEGGVVSKDTLPALLEHAPGPAASLPVDGAGRPKEALLGRVIESDTTGILEAVRRRCLPLRYAHVTSLLVERELVLKLDPPDTGRFGWYAGVEWTARLFSRRRGVLVPASQVCIDNGQVGSPFHALRAGRSAKWRTGETLRELHRSLISALR